MGTFPQSNFCLRANKIRHLSQNLGSFFLELPSSPRQNTPDGPHQEIITQKMEQFFFGEDAARVNLSADKYMIRG
jgi:hypothetical protein